MSQLVSFKNICKNTQLHSFEHKNVSKFKYKDFIKTIKSY